jgi:hypothetical protein
MLYKITLLYHIDFPAQLFEHTAISERDSMHVYIYSREISFWCHSYTLEDSCYWKLIFYVSIIKRTAMEFDSHITP